MYACRNLHRTSSVGKRSVMVGDVNLSPINERDVLSVNSCCVVLRENKKVGFCRVSKYICIHSDHSKLSFYISNFALLHLFSLLCPSPTSPKPCALFCDIRKRFWELVTPSPPSPHSKIAIFTVVLKTI